MITNSFRSEPQLKRPQTPVPDIFLSVGSGFLLSEFRFAATTGGEVRDNLAGALINLRDGATATQSGNLLTATSSLFVNPAAGDLHLLSSATAAIDKAPTLPAVTNDFDGNSRPQGAGYDIGADEYVSSTPPPAAAPPAPPANLRTR